MVLRAAFDEKTQPDFLTRGSIRDSVKNIEKIHQAHLRVFFVSRHRSDSRDSVMDGRATM